MARRVKSTKEKQKKRQDSEIWSFFLHWDCFNYFFCFVVFPLYFCFLLRHFHILGVRKSPLIYSWILKKQTKTSLGLTFCLPAPSPAWREKITLRCAEFRLRYQGIRCVLLVSTNWVFNWMCYLLAAITLTARWRRGRDKRMRRCGCSSLCCRIQTWPRRDWQRHDIGGKQKAPRRVRREMSGEWGFEKKKK